MCICEFVVQRYFFIHVMDKTTFYSVKFFILQTNKEFKKKIWKWIVVCTEENKNKLCTYGKTCSDTQSEDIDYFG